MSNLKRFSDYIKEKDQHREKSEKDVLLDKEIEDIHSEGTEDKSDIDVDEVGDTEGKSDIDVDDVAKLSEVNEGAVKELSYEIQEILKEMMDETVDAYLADENNIVGKDMNGEEVPVEYNMDKISGKYADKVLELVSGSNESLTEKEDIDDDIIDKAEKEMHEETEEDLKDETKKVFNATSKVENELEENTNDENDDDENDDDENDENDENDDDFTVNPDGEDFKLMKKIVGEKADYTKLRKVLKENFPGWEDHADSILEVWRLIK